jgi:hypothetical protein
MHYTRSQGCHHRLKRKLNVLRFILFHWHLLTYPSAFPVGGSFVKEAAEKFITLHPSYQKHNRPEPTAPTDTYTESAFRQASDMALYPPSREQTLESASHQAWDMALDTPSQEQKLESASRQALDMALDTPSQEQYPGPAAPSEAYTESESTSRLTSVYRPITPLELIDISVRR